MTNYPCVAGRLSSDQNLSLELDYQFKTKGIKFSGKKPLKID